MQEDREPTTMERRVYDYVLGFIAKRRYSPTEREIATGIRRSHTNVRFKLARLIEDGYLKRDRGPRSLVVLKPMKKTLAKKRRSCELQRAR